MIEGEFGEDGLAVVPLQVLDSVGRLMAVAAIVDMGFNGDLTLSKQTIQHLGLKSIGVRVGELANGSSAKFNVYEAEVNWHGSHFVVAVMESTTGDLIGTALLTGSRLTIDVHTGGWVTIEPLLRR
jgi:clan AA aspartic protease